jgi:hypothetical protein
MRKLGNRRIETKRGRRIQIAEPEAAAELLDQIVDLNRGKRRVIMFCACLTPLYRGRLACHRVAVAELLLKRARERNLAIEVSEWPGERPVSVSVNVQGFQEKAIAKGMSISQWDLLRAGYRLWRFWDGDHSSDLKPPNFIGRSLRDLRLCKETSGEFV